MSDTILTVNDAARLLGLSVRQIYLMLKDGRLSAIKVGGSTRIWQSEISRYLETCRAYVPRMVAAE